MFLFRRPHYRSDATAFIDQLKAQQPNLEAEQRAGRDRLWDKEINRDLEQDLHAGQIAQPAYVYQTQTHDH
ncbi:MAG: DUF3460 family protein [Burkholderiaceae bacterium]|nr:DUF3460 family protein [Burkholderiaceae bacterium]